MASGEAYDTYYFELFEDHSNRYQSHGNAAAAPAYPEEIPAKKKKGVIKQFAPKTGVKRESITGADRMKIFIMALVSLMAFSIICIDISGWAKGYELSREIAEVKSLIEDAEGENVRLNNALNSKTNIAKVEDYAENVLGMVKLENYQVEYVDLSEGDKIINSAED